MTPQSEVLTGRCMCGAVTIKAAPAKGSLSACHCDMCRQWTSSMLMTFPPAEGWTVEGPAKVFQSSDWAERGFCETCGSSLWYSAKGDGDQPGLTQLAAGLFENAAGGRLRLELWVDKKPGGFAFAEAESRKQLTEAETLALFAPKEGT